jgi:hypothetical protein
VLICLTWAGANLATQPQAAFVETEVALENAIAGSGDNPFYIVCEFCAHTQQYIIKCRYNGGDSCYANWQEPCF